MTAPNIMATLRLMAWERAKGELRSMAQTVWSDRTDAKQYDKFDSLMDKFIREVEDWGLIE